MLLLKNESRRFPALPESGRSTRDEGSSLTLDGCLDQGWPPESDDKKDDRSCCNDQADQLRCRQAGHRRQPKKIAARVVADKFDRKAKDRVDDGVGDQHLSVEFPFAMQ